jgi:hypothetical protein
MTHEAVKNAEAVLAHPDDECYGGVKHHRLGERCPKCNALPSESCGYAGVRIAKLREALSAVLALFKAVPPEVEKLAQFMEDMASILELRGDNLLALRSREAATLLRSLAAENVRLEIRNKSWHEQFWELEAERQAICMAVEHHSNSSTPVSHVVKQKIAGLEAELARHTAPVTDPEVAGLLEATADHLTNTRQWLPTTPLIEQMRALIERLHRQSAPVTGDRAELVKWLHDRLGGVSTPSMGGDNLAILLCGYFDDGEEPDDGRSWSPTAIAACKEVLDAIREHYAAMLEADARREAAIAIASTESGWDHYDDFGRSIFRRYGRAALEAGR